MVMDIVVVRSWERIKLQAAWGWLQGDVALQKRVKVMIEKEEMESRSKIEELKKKERLRKQQDLEHLWKHKAGE